MILPIEPAQVEAHAYLPFVAAEGAIVAVASADTRAFGVDLSRNQGLVDFDVMAAHEGPRVEFIVSRAAISWGYADSWYPRNRAETKRIGRLDGAYHVLYPGENVDRQMDHFFRVLGDEELPDIPLVEDWELVHNQTRLTITKAILACDTRIERHTGKHLLLYSRKNLLEQYTYFEELKHLDLWLAQYASGDFPTPEYPGRPALPAGALAERFHQTGDHTPGAGFGVQSLQLDYDRFNGSVADLYAYVGQGQPPAVAPDLGILWREAGRHGWDLTP